MSKAGEKRASISQAQGGARKRTRGTNVRRPKQSTNSQPTVARVSSSVSANELLWREVTPPERLDDAEGFLGLEEIEDVEVLRDAQGEKSRFRTLYQSDFLSLEVTPLEDQESACSKKLLHSDPEWCGFSDTDEAEHSSGENQVPEQLVPHFSSKSYSNTQRKDCWISSEVPYGVLNHSKEEEAIDVSEWNQLPLSSEVISAIAGLGFSHPTPIQNAVIPEVVAGHDVIGKAVTGSGKTLAFAIPIFQHWLARSFSNTFSRPVQARPPTALVLTPTRELAHQLTRHFEDLVTKVVHQPKIACVTGGLSIQKQARQLVGADVVIATPGRLWEMLNDSDDLSRSLRQIQFLVIDEADRLLSEGHFQELEDILDLLDRSTVREEAVSTPRTSSLEPSSRQTLIFSATFHKGLQSRLTSKSPFSRKALLSGKQSMEYLLEKVSFRESRPRFIDVNPESQMARRLREGLIECPALEKDLYLYSILVQRPRARSLVFTNSISSVRRLASLLKNLDLPVGALHSSMQQKARLRNIERFSQVNKSGQVLIATDVAARGLDIQNIDLILHYHVPRTAETYIHRSGRTARANNRGESLILCSPDEVAGVTRLMVQIHRGTSSKSTPTHLQPVQIDHHFLHRLRPRLSLSQALTDATLAKEKTGSQDDWLRTAADDLGVDFDSDDFAAEEAKCSRGRGSTKRAKQKETAMGVSKAELARWSAELKGMINKPLNLGVSERYVAGGGVDVNKLLLRLDNGGGGGSDDGDGDGDGEEDRFLYHRHHHTATATT